MNFINKLETAFEAKRNVENAFVMAKYMRNHFSFFGIKTEDRRRILKDIFQENNIEVAGNPREIALVLYSKPERELHYCAIEILKKQLKGNYKKGDIQLIENVIITNAWWDSVDTVAKYILGEYLLEHPSETEKVIQRFSNSDNMWLNRSAILFQLGYKQKTNFQMLKGAFEKHKKSNEFFIQKAIGWALREYAKTDPEAVRNFVASADLKTLSKKEALKNMD